MPKRLLKKTWLIRSVFFICAFIVLLIGGITYRNIDDLSKSSESLTQTYKVNVELEQIFSYLKDAETGQRGFIITNDPIYLEPYDSGRENINNSFAELRELTRGNAKLQKDLKELNILIDKRMESFQRSFRFSSVGNYNDPNFKESFLNGKLIMDSIRDKINGMIVHENKVLNLRESTYETNLKVTPFFLYIVLLLSLVLMFFAYNKIITDLKNLKKTNEELEIFKELSNQSAVIGMHGSWMWDIDENTFAFSDNLYRLLGTEPQSFEANIENYSKFIHPEDFEKFKQEVDKMLVEKDLPFISYRIIQRNGDIRYFKAYGKTFINSEGKRQMLGTVSDISDEIKNYALLEERNLELERNNKELSAFNYVASHDLQEPLRKIQTFLSRLEEKEATKLSESGLAYMDRIKNAATRMRLLIDDLLQFSRTNKADKVFEISDINTLIDGAKQDLAEIITEENAIISIDTFPKINVIPFQIQQLFLNLISNSLKYKSQDRIPKIDIRYSKINAVEIPQNLKPKKANYHKITISDNGIGFDNDYAEKIFILFNRLHNKDDYSGTGIGLSICKKIVENHQGYITASGEPNIGSTFTVFLPTT